MKKTLQVEGNVEKGVDNMAMEEMRIRL